MAEPSARERRATASDIKEILSIVKNIEIQNATRDAERRELLRITAKHELCLEGNGKPGLKADIEKMQANVKIAVWVFGIAGGVFIADSVSKVILLLK